MRLLKHEGHGNLNLEEFGDTDIPPYAILSHTWGEDCEEVKYKDFMEGTQKTKIGYNKIEFCRTQAAWDGLNYFWVDTCCIDKSSSAELTEAINSMYRWYQNAQKCYVYLSELSTFNISLPESDFSSGHIKLSRAKAEAAFQDSKWFRRGWTLQELLAPRSVEFFSREGYPLGNRERFEKVIHNITGISIKALNGTSLKTFTVEERFSWAKHRQTKRQEDIAYSLLGIFDVHMPLIYGEGRNNAFARLRKDIDASDQNPPEFEPEVSIDQAVIWKPRYYFFSGDVTPAMIVRAFRPSSMPVVHRAYLDSHEVSKLGEGKYIVRPILDVHGVAYKLKPNGKN